MPLLRPIHRVFAASILVSISFASTATPTGTLQKIVADTNEPQQTIQGFGASDAWNVDFVGKYWSTDEKQKMAQRLFSQEFNEDGSPRGIGLSIWRFNVGAGSAYQGESSGIENLTRRTEGFLLPDGSYDWTKQAGQQWFLRQANEHGVDTLVAFSNSPPVSMTRNGIAHSTSGYKSNLKKNHQEQFSNFLCDVVEHFEDEEIHFDYISSINEPQYEWKTTKQEGSPWTNEQISEMVRSLNQTIEERNSNVQILIPEAADWRNLYELKGENEHSFQLKAFFDPQSPNYLGDLPTVANRFAVHSYWTNSSDSQILDTRKKASSLAEELGVELHQTEYSLIALDRVKDQRPTDDWEVAQFIAKIIHYDLTTANVASWSFWTAMAYERGDMNRYLLLKLKPNKGNDLSSGGTHSASKNLAALGHYSTFIRPGYRRLKTTNTQNKEELLVSSYLSPDDSTGVFVLSNPSKTPKQTILSWYFDDGKISKTTEIYISNKDLELQRNDTLFEDRTITIPAQSLITVVDSF